MGRGCPVVIQTMWKDRLTEADLQGGEGKALVDRIERLAAMGCRLLRFAAPDMEAAETLGALAGRISLPLCADIHFDYKIALRCLDFPVAKLRINPGNIGSAEKVRAVLDKAGEKGVPIRIGVNAGSLPQDLRRRVDEGARGDGNQGGLSRAEALVLAAKRELAIFDEAGFRDVVVSMKASSVAETIAANRAFVREVRGLSSSPPLHIGVTEAGPLVAGTVRNAAALLELLREGIGDTVRVSLSDSPENEVIAAREIIAAAAELRDSTTNGTNQTNGENNNEALVRGVREVRGLKLVSCPRCGRHSFDSIGFTARWQERLYSLDKNITVAIMGCAVNGPGEARHADIGITGAGDKALIFKAGKVIRTIDIEQADAAFEEELKNFR